MTKPTPHKKWGMTYPVTMLKVSDEGPARPFHILRCMSQPPCSHELRLAVGGGVHMLPTHAIMKLAHARGWLADKRGYCLCANHTPWAKRKGEPSHMRPDQKAAAYCAIRDRDMALADAANINDPIRSKNMELAATQTDALLERALADDRNTPQQLTTLEAVLKAIDKGDFAKGWQARVAASINRHPTTFSGDIIKLVARGYLTKVPHSTRLAAVYKPAEAVAKVIENIREEMTVVASEAAAETLASMADQPSIATADRYRVRQFVEQFYDPDNGKWCGDMTDAKAAARLGLPRVFVTTFRSYFGEDVNETDAKRRAEAEAILAEADKLQDEAKALLAKAEARTAEARKLMEG